MLQSGKYDLVAIGNPLLDMSVRDGEALLKKVRCWRPCAQDDGCRLLTLRIALQYNLKDNDAILAGPEHMVR